MNLYKIIGIIQILLVGVGVVVYKISYDQAIYIVSMGIFWAVMGIDEN